MPKKTTAVPFDITKMMMPAFSNWAFAEREDKIEEKTFAGIHCLAEAAVGQMPQSVGWPSVRSGARPKRRSTIT